MVKNHKRDTSQRRSETLKTEKADVRIAPDPSLTFLNEDPRPTTVIEHSRNDASNQFNKLSSARLDSANQGLIPTTVNDTRSSSDTNNAHSNVAETPQEEVRTQTIVAALVALVGSFREETRAQKVLLVSNIVLFFTVLLSPLASQVSSALQLHKWLNVPHPGSEVFLFWFIGVVFMLYGLWSSLPSRQGPEGMAGLRAKQAAEMLSSRDMEKAIPKLKDAVLEEYERLKALNGWPFWVASVAFILCVVIEFFTLIFLVNAPPN